MTQEKCNTLACQKSCATTRIPTVWDWPYLRLPYPLKLLGPTSGGGRTLIPAGGAESPQRLGSAAWTPPPPTRVAFPWAGEKGTGEGTAGNISGRRDGSLAEAVAAVPSATAWFVVVWRGGGDQPSDGTSVASNPEDTACRAFRVPGALAFPLSWQGFWPAT